MKERMIKCRFIVFTIFVAAVFMITAFFLTASTRNTEWSFADGVLTVSGEGDMYNYSEDEGSYPPWRDIRDEIEYAVVEDGITRIGANAFCFCRNLKEVFVGNDVDVIEDGAFFYCKSLYRITFKNKVPSEIADTAFAYDGEIEFK